MIPVIEKIREDHPRMSARVMYTKLKPTCMGRDKFEQFCFDNGFRVKEVKNFRKTTNSNGVVRFPNLIATYELTDINQVFVSDITYYALPEKFDYLTFIMDLYSRDIVGFSVSSTLRTEDTTLPALRMAVKTVGRKAVEGIVFHSDGGGQYYDVEFLKLTNTLRILNSMGKEVYDNPHAERVNGTIKNDYLIPWNPENSPQLGQYTGRAVNNYNTERPHQSLGGLTPSQFREQCTKRQAVMAQIQKGISTENNSESYFPVPTPHHNNSIYKQEKKVNAI